MLAYPLSLLTAVSVDYPVDYVCMTYNFFSAPLPPDNVRVGSIQDRAINVTWSNVASASHYTVFSNYKHSLNYITAI